MLNTVNKAGFERMLADNLRHVIEQRVRLRHAGAVGPIGSAELGHSAHGERRLRLVRWKPQLGWRENLLHLREASHAVRVAEGVRMTAERLPTEACAKFVDQGWVENIGMSDASDLVGKPQRQVHTVSDITGWEGGSRPGYTVVLVLAWSIDPFREEFALFARLMIELQRDVIRVLAASQSSQKVVADLEPVFSHGTVAQGVVVVGQREGLHKEVANRVNPALRDLRGEVAGGDPAAVSILHGAV